MKIESRSTSRLAGRSKPPLWIHVQYVKSWAWLRASESWRR
jgi:hypothetical protein